MASTDGPTGATIAAIAADATVRAGVTYGARPRSIRQHRGGSMSTHSEYPSETRGDGWVTFAMVMLAFAGIVNVLDGIVALTQSKVFVQDAVFVFSDLNTWGWIVLLLGALQLFAAWSIGSGQTWARWFAIFVAGVNAIGQLAWVPAYPVWALAIFAVDILIIYALTVYAPRR
jgi:hypothetical protein